MFKEITLRTNLGERNKNSHHKKGGIFIYTHTEGKNFIVKNKKKTTFFCTSTSKYLQICLLHERQVDTRKTYTRVCCKVN